MAEKLTAKKRKEDLNRLFAEYNRRLGMLYGSYVRKLLALGYSEDVLESDALFNFDNFPLLKARLEEIFNDYFQNSMLCYKSGMTSGVSLAYAHDNDAIGQFSVLTDKALETARKTAAATFIANRLNSKIGLNLAQSVWNYCQQTKAEFEMAMSNVIADGLGKGESAEEVGRRIRQYLNNPDMMYRRYHTVKVLKNGQKKDIVTWRRKRIIDGRVRFVEEPLEHVGLGVYRSARKNALRVARTEINAAYHTARNERWANEPFVIGQHIHVSPQHDPEEDADICDELEGYYPKGFVWNGWHPQCYAEGTQVLTTKGWKEFKDVTTQDIVYSLNPQTREIEETSIVGVQKYPYNGELIHFFNRSLECLVTPEHQMVYISKSGAHEIKKCNATEYKPSMGAFYRSAVNTAKDRTNIMFGDKNIPFDVYCEFMGYYLADGSMQHDYGIVLSQEKGQPAWKRMQTCIKKMGFTPHVYKSTIVLYHRAFGQELLKYGTAHYKYIPQEILNASKRQIQIFLDAFIVCDGHIKKPRPFMGNRGHVCTPNHGERMYFTSSPQMAAEIGLLLLKVGHRPSYRIMSPKNTVKKDGTVIKQRYDCYRISECDSATATVFNKEKVEYIGFVYDVTLENNHIMYIQKDGKCFWGSNCMCTSDPVMISGEERKQFYKRLFNGEDMSNYVSPNRIKDMPDQYKRYIEDNADKIVDAYKRDKLAWHLANNKSYWIKYLNATQRKQMGADAMSRREAIQEIVKARHAKRDANKIQQKWTLRRSGMYMERMNEVIGHLTYSDYATMGKALQKRYQDVVDALKLNKTWDINNMERLFRRFKQGVSIRERWDKLLWDGFSSEQIKNCRELEKKLGILKGRLMSWERADQQNANPGYVYGVKNGYQINCATCSPTYMMRLMGFNVTADNYSNPLVEYLSKGLQCWEKWLNADGTQATWVELNQWKNARGYKDMTTLRYKEFIEDVCKEEGVYEMSIGWARGGGHSTIIQRFADGSLKRVDAQVYCQRYYGVDEKMSLANLCKYGEAHSKGWNVPFIDRCRGIMRIDNKLFNPAFAKIFQVAK
jgi:hypothetical protein